MERFPVLQEFNIAYNEINDLSNVIEEISKIKSIRSFDMKANMFNQFVSFDSLILTKNKEITMESIEK